MAVTKLRLYQDAARLLGEARFALITDDVETRYALDDAYPEATAFVLRQAPWHYAIKTATLGAAGSPASGYANSYTLPADAHLVHAIYKIGGAGRECPIDLRQQDQIISTNVLAPSARYVSADYLDVDAKPPSEHVAQIMAAYLAFLVAERVTGEAAAASRMSQLFASLLPEAKRIDALDDDLWLPHQRSGRFQRVARTMIDEGFWRFALVTALIATIPGGGGFTRQATIPAAWSRTRQLYLRAPDGRRVPFDVRERGGLWLTDALNFYAEYISADLAMDSTAWPDHYMRAVLRALQFDEVAGTGAGQQEQADAASWKDALAATLDSEADPADPWLEHQLDGLFDRGRHTVLMRGNWRWALKEQQYSALTDQSATLADYGLPYRFDRPADWFKTHALFVPWDGQECPVNIRESGGAWSTDAASFVARYLAASVLDATGWPEVVARAVLAWCMWQDAPAEKAQPLALEYEKMLADAMTTHSREDDDWLDYQLDGDYQAGIKRLLAEGRWRFAVKTAVLTDTTDPLPAAESDGTVSDGYRYRFIQPNDLLRTLEIYYRQGEAGYATLSNIAYRDEGGAFHADFTPIVVRYISRLGLDSTKWAPHFRDALLAWLQYQEARENPQMVAVAKAKLELFEMACEEAEMLDDSRDVPPRPRSGRFIRGRYGRGTLDLEQAWPPFTLL